MEKRYASETNQIHLKSNNTNIFEFNIVFLINSLVLTGIAYLSLGTDWQRHVDNSENFITKVQFRKTRIKINRYC